MADVEVPPEGPAWMLALEKKRQRTHRLAHEVGAGSLCLLCKDDCPGLDLHFWRKLCRNCKCKKEDHDVIDDCGLEQFEILLGGGNSTNRPKKAFLELLEKHTSAGLKNKAKSVAFDWVPPDVSPIIAAEYMQSLPANKLPISGSDGALYRRQQLERQLPLHDLDANHCHQLTESEVDNLKKYLENLKNNVVGQGRVSKLFIPSSNSLDSLQKMNTFNSIPKPFQTHAAAYCPSSDSSPQAAVGSNVSSGQALNLKPPSAFWPKSVSPDLHRSLSPQPPSSLAMNPDAVCHSTDPKSSGSALDEVSQQILHTPADRKANQPGNFPNSFGFDGQLVRDYPPKSFALSENVPGNMWVPAECSECSKKSVDGQLVADRVCSHIVKSDKVSLHGTPGKVLPVVCSECSKKGVDGKVIRDQVCTHIQEDSIHPPTQMQTISSSTNHTAAALPGSSLSLYESGLPIHPGRQDKHSDYLQISNSSPSVKSSIVGSSFMPAQDPSLNNILPSSLKPVRGDFSSGENQMTDAFSNLRVPSPNTMEKSNPLPLGVSSQRNKSPTSTTSTAGTPYAMAMYAHNALNDLPNLEPQDTLSPHVASMSMDDKAKCAEAIEKQLGDNIEIHSQLNLELHCAECREDILPDEVVVFADRAGPEIVWHPKCFVCSTCQELLVDLVYFFNKGQVYCGRHYAELLDIPRCCACDELIFVNEYTMAEGQAFHVKHFCCFECDDPLGGKQYVAKDGQPVCLPCYEKKYGKQCSTCNLVIGAKDQGVTWKDQHWHATSNCFCCFRCQKSLLGGRFAVKNQLPYCSKECMQAGI